MSRSALVGTVPQGTEALKVIRQGGKLFALYGRFPVG
jgi:hypothetical protein